MSKLLISTGGFIILVVLFYIFFVYEQYTPSTGSDGEEDPGAGYALWTEGLSNDDIQTAINATAAYLKKEPCLQGIETTDIQKYTSGTSVRYVCSFMFTAKNKRGFPYAFRVDSIVDDGKATSVIRETEERVADQSDLSYLPYSEIREFKFKK